MQTTLRIDDDLYREAKAEAARRGTTLTRFLEEGLRIQLRQNAADALPTFRSYTATAASPLSWEEIKRIADKEQEKDDLAKLGLVLPESES